MIARLAVVAVAGGLLLAGSAPSDPGPAGGRLLPPLPGAAMTQPFGCTGLELEPADPACPEGHFHAGIDLGAPAGTTVLAAGGGIASVIDDPGGYGLHVLIDHGGGLVSLYGHLAAALVGTGDRVGSGAPIGLVGSSGNSTGPHLHFEVRRDGRPVDPIPLIRSGQ